MSAEQEFKDNCGPDVAFVSVERLEHARRLEFSFEARRRYKVVSLDLAENPNLSDEEAGRMAGQMALEWAKG
jgi:hypothetical protein